MFSTHGGPSNTFLAELGNLPVTILSDVFQLQYQTCTQDLHYIAIRKEFAIFFFFSSNNMLHRLAKLL